MEGQTRRPSPPSLLVRWRVADGPDEAREALSRRRPSVAEPGRRGAFCTTVGILNGPVHGARASVGLMGGQYGSQSYDRPGRDGRVLPRTHRPGTDRRDL